MNSNTTVLNRGRACALAALVTLALAGTAPAATMPSDAWITTKVKISLATTKGVSATDVNVDTVDHQVTLHGIVNSPSEKAMAEQTARSVEGVKTVRNLLQVVSTKREAKVEARDEDISKQVTEALDKEPSIKDSSISVQSVNKGVVILKGTSTTLSDHLTALRIAQRVPGVQQVASEVQTPNEVADTSIWKDPAGAIGNAADSTRDATKDLYITSMVKMKLLADSETPAMDINVDTRDGVVTLFGIVPTVESKSAAESEAGKTAGVAAVKNQLQVVATAKQPAVKANDDVVESNLKKNLESHSDLGKVDIQVENCVARLTGSVASGFDRVEALQVARATTGVCAVKDDLTIQ
jgi:osmotically-inducible protein OsmY